MNVSYSILSEERKVVNVENLIFEGKCFVQLKQEVEEISKLKDIITQFMVKQNYYSSDQPIFFKDNFLTMDFTIVPYPKDVRLGLKIKKSLGLISTEDFSWEKYACSLKTLRKDLPYKINILISRRRLKDTDGFLIIIRSEPVILYCIRQLGYSSNISDFEYESIAESNKHLINKIMIGLWTTIIEEPKAIKKFVKTPVIEKLERLNFDKTVKLLKSGRKKLERGGDGITDGLADLRSSLEIFAQELLEKIGEKPLSQQKLRQNLKILEDKKNLNKEISKFMTKTLDSWLWQYLSEKPVHKREDINIIDAKFLFSISEECVDHLLDKILYGV